MPDRSGHTHEGPPPSRTRGATGDPAAPIAPTAARPDRAWWGMALIYVATAFLYMAPALAGPRQLSGTDYTPAGFMVMEFLSAAIARGELPSWIPHVMGGVPLFANPGSTFHPARLLLALALPVERVLPALFAVHFAVAGIGAALLLRELGVRRAIAFGGGLAYEFTGQLASLIYAGHDGRFIVAASAPLFLWGLHRGVRTGGGAPFLVAALALGGALLSFQLQSVYYLLLLGGAWTLYALRAHPAPARARVRRAAAALLVVATGFALAAVNLLPFAGYVDASPRATSVGRGYAFATSYSMPPGETFGVAVPEAAGVLDRYRGTSAFKLHTEYAGAPVVALLVLGLALAAGDRRWRFFAGAAVVALTVAWGGNTPVYRAYYALLPGFAQLRAPSIAFYVVSLAAVVMAALTLDRLAALRDDAAARAAGARGPARLRLARGLLLALVALSVLATVTTPLAGPAAADAARGWLRFTIALAATVALLVAWLAGVLPGRRLAPLLAVVVVVDLWVVDRRFFLLVEPPAELYAADDVVDFLRAQPDLGRVWVYSRAQPGDGGGWLGNGRFGPRSNYLMHFGIPQVGGEHGNQLQRWNEYGGVGPGNVLVDWHNLEESSAMRSAAGVRYAVARVDLSQERLADGRDVASGFRKVHDGAAMVFRNERALPRAYVVPETRVAAGRDAALAAMRAPDWDPRRTAILDAPLPTPLPGGGRGTAAIVADGAERVDVRTTTDRPALLVLADNHYPDWTAAIDGAPAPLLRVNHTFRGVVVPRGTHVVRFAFRPTALWRGLAISLATLLACACYGAWLAARRGRPPAA